MINILQHLDVWTSAVETRSTAGRGSSNKLNLYGIKKLRELILELAVRGQLVPQNPADEPASVLLEKIAAEKARLIKDGKLKKQEPLPAITDDEKPFELPEGWEWARLDSLSLKSEAGWSPKCIETPREGENWGVLKVSAVTWGEFKPEENKELPTHLEPRKDYEVQAGDFLISRANTAELVAKAVIVPESAPNHLMMSDKIIRFVFSKEIFGQYISLANNSQSARNYYMSVAGGTSSSMKNVSREQIRNLLIALPPLPEQHRIVAKVNELMSLCDALEQEQAANIAAHQTLVEELLAALTSSTPNSPPSLTLPPQGVEGTREKNRDALLLPSPLAGEGLGMGGMPAWARIATHFDTLFTTEHSIDQLKQTILQLAVMGKLIPFPDNSPSGVVKDFLAFGPRNGLSPQESPKETPYKVLKLGATSYGILDLEQVKHVDIDIEDDSHLWLKNGDILIQRGNSHNSLTGKPLV